MNHDEIDPSVVRDATAGEEFRVPAGEIRNRAHRIRRRRRAAALLAPLALAGVAATGYATMSADDVGPNSVFCHAQARMGGDQLSVTSNAADPVELCAAMWQDGEVDPAVAEAPALLACVDEAGVVRVIPDDGDAACSKLGMHDLPRGYGETARRYLAMRTELVRRFKAAATAGGAAATDACLPRDEALDVVRTTLAREGFREWRAVADEEGSCWNYLSFDDLGKTIGIQGSSKPGIEDKPYSTS